MASGLPTMPGSKAPSDQVVTLVDGEEQLFAANHPIWKLLLVLTVGLLALGGVASPSLVGGLL